MKTAIFVVRAPRRHQRQCRYKQRWTNGLLLVALGVTLRTAGCPAQSLEDSFRDHPIPGLSADGSTRSAPSSNPVHTIILSLEQAEQMALRNNPQYSAVRLEALAEDQVAREKQSIELPQITGDLTAAEAYTGSRLGASDSLTDSRLFTHAGTQVTVSEMVTDFGRTSNLVAAYRISAKAKHTDELATCVNIVLATDRAFFGVLHAGAMLRFAQQNLAHRQATHAQVNALTLMGKHSPLDASLADGSVSQARLTLIEAQSDLQEAKALLNEVLGVDQEQEYALRDEAAADEPPPPADEAALVRLAAQQRPEIVAANLHQQAAESYSRAQADQLRPTIRAIGTVGGEPIPPGRYFISSWDGAMGVNVSVPIFDGFAARSAAHKAQLQAQIAREQTRQVRDRVTREVVSAWLHAKSSFQRRVVTAQMLDQANRNVALAMSQYELGFASYMELSHAEAQQAAAQVAATSADYAYRSATAVLRREVSSARRWESGSAPCYSSMKHVDD